jgi:hypothetical protein
MKLEDQVCSLELAIKLKELGVKKDTQFYWCNIESIGTHVILDNELWIIAHVSQITALSENWYSAFTVAELGEMLPGIFNKNGNRFYLSMDCDKCPYYEDMPKTEEIYSGMDKDNDSEADARAKMLIYLIENKLIEIK